MVSLTSYFPGGFNPNDYKSVALTVAVSDRELAFREFMSASGLRPNGSLRGDGEFSRVDDVDKKQNSKDGWYVLHHGDGLSWGSCGSHVHQSLHSWCSKGDRITESERRQINDAHERAQKLAEDTRKSAIEAARAKIQSLPPAATDHPYLIKKRVSPAGILQDGDRLLIPMTSAAGEIQSYQTIGNDGDKLFCKDAPKKGNFHLIGTIADPIYLVEGWATGKTIAEATGRGVYVAFDCGNLKPVAEAIRVKSPSARIVICADDDQWTKGNPGLRHAQAVAQDIKNVTVAVPRFKSTANNPTDFNDLAGMEGLIAVQAQLAGDQAPIFRLSDWTASRYQGAAPEIEWLCYGAIPLGVPVLFAAMGGLGKSYLALDLALAIAVGVTNIIAPKTLLGGRVVAQGTAVILSAEDSRDSIHRRLEAIDPQETRLRDPSKLIVVPLPDAGGPRPLIANDGRHLTATPFFRDLLAQLKAIPDLRLVVIDPLQAFVMADVNADPAAGQFMWSAFAEICAVTGATVIAAHHMKKDGAFDIETADKARESIRGSTALVDGARLVYALWKTKEDKARALCNETDTEYEDGKVVSGAIVKANDRANRNMQTYVRQPSGVLANLSGFKIEKMKRSALTLTRAQTEQLMRAVEDKFLSDTPYSSSSNSGTRWLGHYLMHEFDLRKTVAKDLVTALVTQEIVIEEMVDKRAKKMGLRAGILE